MDATVSCLHGTWVNGICECERGFTSVFRDTELYPIYCGKKEEDVLVINLRNGYETIDFLHYAAMSITVALAVESFLAFAFLLYTIVDSCLLQRKIEEAQIKLEAFKNNLIRRNSTENLNAELWYPDLNEYRCINDPDFTVEKAMEEKEKGQSKVLYAKVITSYKPRDSGELRLHVGDTITDVVRLAQGWCKGKVNGKTGFYPEAYAEAFEPTESDLEGGNKFSSSDEEVEENGNRKRSTTDSTRSKSASVSGGGNQGMDASVAQGSNKAVKVSKGKQVSSNGYLALATAENTQYSDEDDGYTDEDSQYTDELSQDSSDYQDTSRLIKGKTKKDGLKMNDAKKKVSRKKSGRKRWIEEDKKSSKTSVGTKEMAMDSKESKKRKKDSKIGSAAVNKGDDYSKRNSATSKKLAATKTKNETGMDSKRGSAVAKRGTEIDSKRSGASSKRPSEDKRNVNKTGSMKKVPMMPPLIKDLKTGASNLKKTGKTSSRKISGPTVEDFVFSSDDTN